jgi:hypothetical protein
VSPDLEKLITLQEIDLKIQRLTIRLSAIPAERAQIEARFNEFSATYTGIREQLESAYKQRKELEVELEQTQHHHEKYKQDLMKVRNEKEYATCLREIDATKKASSQLETQLLQLMDDIEKLEAEAKEFAPEVEKRRSIIDQELASYDQELAEADQQIAVIKDERNQLVQDMPKSLFEQYERVARLRNGIALSEARNGSCSVCRMRIRPQAFSEVRRGEQIIICENCSRILFYRVEPETAAML